MSATNETSDATAPNSRKKRGTSASHRWVKESELSSLNLNEQAESTNRTEDNNSEESKEEGKEDAEVTIDPARETGEKRSVPLTRRLLKKKLSEPLWKVYPAIYFNKPDKNAGKGFPSNFISTTKYTIWNFLPKNLFEQFRRFTNFYFLLITIITLIPVISPLTPITSVLPLLFVLLVSSIKEAYEDYLRYAADKKVNNAEFKLLQPDGHSRTALSMELKVGDVIKLEKDSTFPADLILLSTSLEDGICYVETAQLDGESNLKVLKALPETQCIHPDKLIGLDAVIECEEPHNQLYTFNARIMFNGKVHSVNTQQLLLRGARLRNTGWAIGVVVYTGDDTKLSLNQKDPPSKFSTAEKLMNKLVLSIPIFQLIFTITASILAGTFQDMTAKEHTYLSTTESGAVVAIKDFFAYFVLLSFFIPSSMMVTLEIVRVVQSKLMEWDEEMYANKNDPHSGMIAKTSNLNDELALVKYIFSDKTGTLTQNKMEFSKCSVDGHVYNAANSGELYNMLKEHQWKPGVENSDVDAIVDFLRVLSLCHSVVIEEGTEKDPVYQAQSPDEVALATAAKVNSFIFKSRKSEGIRIIESGEERLYELLNSFDFTSERARMSVVVRTPEGTIKMFAKGADSVMLRLLSKRSKKLASATKKHINQFSKEGLRTLIVAKKDLSEAEYRSWYKEFHAANTAIQDRERKVAAVVAKLEANFDLVGCTAIEDKLQDEVPETIHYLIEAGIKVWVITGDKQETAINIGYSTQLFKKGQKLVIINVEESKTASQEAEQKLQQALSSITPGESVGLVIDGATLRVVLHDHKELLFKLGMLCTSVLCCRVTPLQKAQIVHLVKSSTGEVCLAIGDGANDVSMIQEAHIGVGIFGKEGTQAARASDYALQQFKHLKRLLAVHGRYSMVRNALLVKASLYKSFAFFLCQFWFALFNGASAQTVYDDWIVTGFNIFLTSAPPFFIGIFEKDIPEKIILEHPKSYLQIQSGSTFTVLTVFFWLLSAFYHSCVLFFVTVALLIPNVIDTNGQVTDMWTQSWLVSTIGLMVVLSKIAMEVKHWTWVNQLAHWGSMLIYYLLLILLSSMLETWPQGYNLFFQMARLAVVYLGVIIAVCIALLPDLTVHYVRRNYYPTDHHILQELHSRYSFKEQTSHSSITELPDIELTEVRSATKIGNLT